jgi:hypothetical protein
VVGTQSPIEKLVYRFPHDCDGVAISMPGLLPSDVHLDPRCFAQEEPIVQAHLADLLQELESSLTVCGTPVK